ncbi:unnamed protein product [Meganyctiphanes norvegica]|uniref:Uncharacterized protein n=1 Tax=Meganyctiphanes norvegica TaxID=48144 RepID=A0AAV2QS36_MEGNR
MSTVEFLIKNKHCGKYIHARIPTDFEGNLLNLWDTVHPRAHFVFEHVEDEWGYIREKDSNKVWHPECGSNLTTFPSQRLVLHPDRKRHALFSIDQTTGHIMHRDGLFVHYWSGTSAYPPNGRHLTLHQDIHEGMKWQCLNVNDTSKEVHAYGSAKILGDWKLVLSVMNPQAEQKMTYKYTVGKSSTTTTSGSFQFGWEATASAGIWMLEMSATTSLAVEIQRSHEDTWKEEQTKNNEITVKPGFPCAVWQRIITGAQHGHEAIFQVDPFEHTKDDNVKPED